MAYPLTPIDGDSIQRQLELLRFGEELQNVLIRCPDEAAVSSAVVHRLVSAFFAKSGCFAVYEPIAGRFDVVMHTRGQPEWPVPLFARALAEGHQVQGDGVIAVPFTCQEMPCGVLGLQRDLPFDRLERQALRGVAQRVGVEVERRRDQVLDDVLDSLLRKTKPIDVYTHALRELRKFIRYDHSASIMTATRELHQLVVRVEKVVTQKAGSESLADSSRVGSSLSLAANVSVAENPLAQPANAVRYAGTEWHLITGDESSLGIAGVTALGVHAETVPQEGSQLLWPLTFGGQMLGVLRIAAVRPGAFEAGRGHSRVIERMARLLSVTIYRSDLYYQSERQLQAIKDLGRLTTHPLPVEHVCAHTLGCALSALHVEAGAVLLLDDAGTLNVVAEQGAGPDAPRQLRSGVGVAGMVASTGKAMPVPDVAREPAYVAFNDRVRSMLAVPIKYGEIEVLGVLSVMSLEGHRFREEDEEVISFLDALANQTAVAIKNSGLRAHAIDRFGLHSMADLGMSNADFYQRILEEDQQRRARQEVQQELSRRLMRTERLNEILNEVISLCLDRAAGDGACLYLLREGSLALSAHLARRGSNPRWLHEYRPGREALDRAAASFADAGAEHAWVLRLPEEADGTRVLPECDAVVAPLYGRSRTRGLLCVLRMTSPRRPTPGQNESELLAAVAGLAAVAIEKLRQREQMRALHSIDQAIGAGKLLSPVFAKVIDGINLSSPGDGAGYIVLGQGVLDPVKPALFGGERGLRVCTSPVDRDIADAALQTIRQEGGTALRRGPKFSVSSSCPSRQTRCSRRRSSWARTCAAHSCSGTRGRTRSPTKMTTGSARLRPRRRSPSRRGSTRRCCSGVQISFALPTRGCRQPAGRRASFWPI